MQELIGAQNDHHPIVKAIFQKTDQRGKFKKVMVLL